jgi:hypothetical protein
MRKTHIGCSKLILESLARVLLECVTPECRRIERDAACEKG